MNSLQQAIVALKLSETSCRQEASGKLDGDRSEGLNCIGDSLAIVHRFLASLAKRHPVFLTAKQQAALKDLAAQAERDDLLAALESTL